MQIFQRNVVFEVPWRWRLYFPPETSKLYYTKWRHTRQNCKFRDHYRENLKLAYLNI